MFNRRSMLLGLLAASALTTHAATLGSRQPSLYLADTAPHPTGRAILRDALRGLDAGASGEHDVADAIRRNFPQIIEQNFAMIDETRFEVLVAALSPHELSMLAHLYLARCAELGRETRLLLLFAERSAIDTLVRISHAFGHDHVAHALAQARQEALPEFELAWSAHAASGFSAVAPEPVPGAPHGAAASGPTHHYTIHEIYLSFRTAPVGALSVRAAVYETTLFASRRLVPAWGAGYWVGAQIVAPMIQTYWPAGWDAVGATVHNIVQSLSQTSDIVASAFLERQTGNSFGLSAVEIAAFQSTGGDYGVARNWYEVLGAGGGNPLCHVFMCPPPEHH
jgi:hypothetical protein